MKLLKFVLPYPPSANQYWRHVITARNQVRVLISKKARQYRHAVRAAVIDQFGYRREPIMQGSVSLKVRVVPSDNRTQDIDNTLKQPIDALQHAMVFKNDKQIDSIYITRAPNNKDKPRIVVGVSSGGLEGYEKADITQCLSLAISRFSGIVAAMETGEIDRNEAILRVRDCIFDMEIV